MILEETRFSDLLVMGTHNPEAGGLGDLAGSLILSTGRPVLIVPPETPAKKVGQRVMVGWDASTPAARAVNDAIPLLAGADEVDIVAINAESSQAGVGAIRCAEIGRHLARHGIKAETQSISVDNVGVADVLMSRAADRKVDLFVMGA
ncbi:MAG: universal stress protein [Rhodospirillales bacterium]|nr:universal stress protein [Rhodospirillales bacterium]